MKKTYGTILVLSTAILVLLTASVACLAAEEKEEKIWRDEGPRHRGRQFELTDEIIERVMERLKEANPERAEELKRLREKNPEQFKAELREVMREQFGKGFRERMEWREGREPRPSQEFPLVGPRPGGLGAPAWGEPRPGGPGEPPKAGPRPRRMGEGREMMMGPMGQQHREREMRMRERHAEYLEWLKENYPEEAEKLAELKEEKPELHMRQFWLSYRKYRRIFEASEENPELVEVLKEDLVLKSKRDKLLGKIRAASEDEKKELVKKLENVVSSRFDLIVKRKQIRYEHLRTELEKLKERVKKSETEVEKWKKVKSEKVKGRLAELISRSEKFRWD